MTGAPAPTALGVLGEPLHALADRAGTVELAHRGARFEWWVGADDRWHRPHAGVAVRHRLLDGAPVSETTVRVPGGDARWRAYGASTASGPAVVLEATNLGRGPFALAIAVRLASVSTVWLKTGRLEVDGEALLGWARAPGRVAAGSADLFYIVAGGGAAEVEVAAGGGGNLLGRFTHVALLWPLAHGASSTFVVPVGPPSGPTAAASAVPDAEAVARGWARQLDAVAAVDVGDTTLEAAVRRERAQLLLLAPSRGTALEATLLDGWGHHDEAAALLATLAAGLGRAAPDAAAAWLRAAELHRRLAVDPGPAAAMVEAVLMALRRVGRRQLDDATRRAAARLLADSGQREAAEQLRRPARRSRAGALPTEAKAFLAEVRDELVQLHEHEPDAEGQGAIELWPGWTAAHLGRPADLRRLPTGWGPLSFSLRWHGSRPALLWEIEPRSGEGSARGPGPVLGAPGIDAAWTGNGWRGEALLAAPDAAVADGASFR